MIPAQKSLFINTPLFDEIKNQKEGSVTPRKVIQHLGEIPFPDPLENRPYLYGCMVLSFDGKMGFYDNPEGTLISKCNTHDPAGAAMDFWIMNVCRALADGVILGPGTLKARPHKLWYAQIFDQDLIDARRRELSCYSDHPVSIVVSLDGKDLPLELKIFSMKPAPVILTSPAGADYVCESLGKHQSVSTRRADPRENLNVPDDSIRIVAAGKGPVPDTPLLMKALRNHGIHRVSVEAPRYIWHLMHEKLLDEFFLNYSGVYAGGEQSIGTDSVYASDAHPHGGLVSIGYDRGFIFTRQKVIYAG